MYICIYICTYICVCTPGPLPKYRPYTPNKKHHCTNSVSSSPRCQETHVGCTPMEHGDGSHLRFFAAPSRCFVPVK